MIPDTYLDAPGAITAPGDLHIAKAQETVRALTGGALPFVEFVECRRVPSVAEGGDGTEVVVFDVEVELSQLKSQDIHRRERVAVVYHPSDVATPEVLTLRADFPRVGHLNPRLVELPRSLCLYDAPYSELKLQWTAAGFVGRIREWFAKTAQETLHADDQPLEPLLVGAFCPIVLPPDLFSGGDLALPDHLAVYGVDSGDDRMVLIANPSKSNPPGQKAMAFVAVGVQGQPQQHGPIHKPPTDLQQLGCFLAKAGIDLRAALHERLRSWRGDPQTLNTNMILIAALPKIRHEGAEPEATDIWAFMFTRKEAEAPTNGKKPSFCTALEVGRRVGLWEVHDQQLGLLLAPDDSKQGADVGVVLLNPTYAFSREGAARSNGQAKRESRKMTLIGAGALGSQVYTNLLRAGFGEWDLIDKDHLLPHNLAKHALFGFHVGYPKVNCLAELANETIYGDPVATPILADVLEPGRAADQVNQSLNESALILDCSASVAVARHLARDLETPARRVSLFLNPSGSDGVLLAEDAERKIPLDTLEMQYYRLLISDPALSGHMRQPGGRIRYGFSCRDFSSAIPQDLVALHAASGSRALNRVAQDDAAIIRLWRTNPDNFAVQEITVSLSSVVEHPLNGWTLCTDESLLNKIGGLRCAKLPNETGGILIGSYDTQRKIVYVVDTVPSPPDSREWPTVYIRGCQGLREQVDRIETATAGMLGYVGEWHSHPDGCSSRPSGDDRNVFAWLTEIISPNDLPPLMLIVGEGDQLGWHLGQLMD